MDARNQADRCPPDNINDVLESQFQSEEEMEEARASNQTDSSSQIEEPTI
jgi:hypothetical protein